MQEPVWRDAGNVGGVGGESALSVIEDRIRCFAGLHRTVVFEGAVGVGKTTLARRLHVASGRPGPLIIVSAGEVSEDLFRDRLFGHVTGAFTGAASDRPGALEAAAGGTLLIDDAALLARSVQSPLLRVLESGRYTKVGADTDRKVECRIVFATTEPLETLVAEGRMIPDLASRIGYFRIHVPTLVSQPARIPGLVRRYAADFRLEHDQEPIVDFTVAAMIRLVFYGWPGNLRELRNAVEVAVAMAGAGQPVPVVDACHLPCPVRRTDPQLTPERVLLVLDMVGGKLNVAAELLGVHRNTIRKYRDAARDAA